ncbi:DNA polymerase theta-like protein [Medicago truncatula]|uniref:DNA polymerase theta-like protein n=1 Tax=Medicago truncatula TaxID=3880 RepID=A0A072TEZ2_MEDTR|nr:DNA polymerase theta-like protein [Medicago truncatula]
MELSRTIPKGADLGGKDPDHVVELCNEVVQEGQSVLIFCSSRKGCESTGRHVAKFLKSFTVDINENNCEFADITSAINSLRKCPAGLDPVLEETFPAGVAFHHAGLTVEEREIVETCYRKDLLRVLTATSTLAAGVNPPARRVVICKPQELKKVMGLLNESCPPLHSCLSEDLNGMIHAILEVVAGGIVQTTNDIHRYVRCTLLNSTKPFLDVIKSAQESLRWLCQRKFLEWNEDTKLYSTTPLGRASFGSSLCPEESLIVLADLSREREGFVLASDLHLVYLVTPINVDVEPDWESYYERFVKLSPLDQSVGNRVGVTEPFLMRMAHGVPVGSNKSRWSNNKRQNQHGMSSGIVNSDDQTLRVCRRFYVALILSLLVQETPVGEVCETFKVARGMVQGLQENAGRAEVVELTTIPYVKGSRARALYKAGLRTPLAIAEASIPELVKALFESSSWGTEGSAQRSLQFGVAKKIKNGARKIVLDKAEEARIAAFSACKSLGYDVPQFAPPISTALCNSIRKEVGISSGSDTADTSHSFIDANHIGNSNVAALEKEKDLIKSSDRSALVSVEGKSDSMKPHSLSTVPVVVPTINEPSMAFGPAKIPDVTTLSVHLQKQNDKSIMHNGCHAQGTGEQNHRGNLASGNMINTSRKGPINAVSSPGGLDIHCIKRLELHSAAPFEIHGIAICWENSPMYYINLPRDILLSENRKDDSFSLTACSSKQRVSSSNSKQDSMHRWSRISKIIEKKEVRKFTWNLKVQIQVLKKPSVSVQRFGSLDTIDKNMHLEVVDNSYILLPPIHVKDAIDMCIVAWILLPDEESSSSPNLDKEVKKRLSPEDAEAANQCGRWRNQMRKAAHNGWLLPSGCSNTSIMFCSLEIACF